VKTEALEAFRQQLTHFRWLPVVADENSPARSAASSPTILTTPC
jgi:hypothetical protein